jgi:hypothetical protein
MFRSVRSHYDAFYVFFLLPKSLPAPAPSINALTAERSLRAGLLMMVIRFILSSRIEVEAATGGVVK